MSLSRDPLRSIDRSFVVILIFEEMETLLNRCIMLGQFEAAVELCLNEQHYTEALLVANLGGQELLNKVQKRYFDQVQTPTTKVRIQPYDERTTSLL